MVTRFSVVSVANGSYPRVCTPGDRARPLQFTGSGSWIPLLDFVPLRGQLQGRLDKMEGGSLGGARGNTEAPEPGGESIGKHLWTL